mgnify:CR=1 FL=1
MVIRKDSYLHIDGSFLLIDELHCLYVSPSKKGIVAVYQDGQQTEIKYDGGDSCGKAWRELVKAFEPDIAGRVFLNPHKTLILRLEGLRYAEFDMIDYRFILQYKGGATYVYKYESSKVTYGIYSALMRELTGHVMTGDHPISENRMRADFWADPVTTIDGLTVGEDIPNAEYWAMVDKAFVSASKRRGKPKK